MSHTFWLSGRASLCERSRAFSGLHALYHFRILRHTLMPCYRSSLLLQAMAAWPGVVAAPPRGQSVWPHSSDQDAAWCLSYPCYRGPAYVEPGAVEGPCLAWAALCLCSICRGVCWRVAGCACCLFSENGERVQDLLSGWGCVTTLPVFVFDSGCVARQSVHTLPVWPLVEGLCVGRAGYFCQLAFSEARCDL